MKDDNLGHSNLFYEYMKHTRITLDQWQSLVAIVETGGYAKASARLNRSQSTVTYNVKKIEELLGVKVFEIQGRKAVLTAAGTVLYRRGRSLVDEARRLEQAAAELARGWEPEIRLVVDVVFPTWLLLECLAAFDRDHPHTRIDLVESVLGGTDEALLEGRADLAIGSHVPEGFLGDPLLDVRFVCAAAPGHPLHGLGRPLDLEDLRPYCHLVVRDSGAQRDRSGGWLNERRWTVTAKATSIRAATLGYGFAWYPEDSIRQELESGALKPLPLREGGERRALLHLISPDRDTVRPGARHLAGIIRAAVGRCPAPHLPPGAPH
jgi:DNA-binding transcriptional LysR family regulator